MYCPAEIASHTTRVRQTRRKSPTRDASARNTCGCTRRSQKLTISWRASRLTLATPTRTSFHLTGADGGPLRGDVRTAGGSGARPAVVICPGFNDAAERLARAGFMAVSFDFPGGGAPMLRDLEIVMAALMRGEW